MIREAYKKAGREDLLKKEQRSCIINSFLPKQMSEEESKNICEKVIKDLGATSIKDMGKVEFKKDYGMFWIFQKLAISSNRY